MIWIYNVSIALYVLSIRIAALFIKKAAQWVKGRTDIFKILENKFSHNSLPVAWFHAASLGEFEQARPVIEAFRKHYPNYKILLTFFSPSGYEIRKNYIGADDIVYLPADTKKNAAKFLTIVKPTIVLFVKYEFWFHYLNEIHKREIPLLLFSAIFRKEQPFFSKHTNFYKNMLPFFTWIFVQDQTSQKLLNTIGCLNTSAIGDTRFDRVKQLFDSRKELPVAAAFKNGGKLFIVGSAWNNDMEILFPFMNDPKYKNLKFIVAPHEIKEEEIKGWQKKINRKSILYSEASEQNIKDKEIMFINNIGMLSSLYQYAEYAWIGGAFGKGLHNILEAATFGMPVFFGTNYKKFKEAKDLIHEGAAFSVKNSVDFETLFSHLWGEELKRKKLSEVALQYVKNNTGATNAIMHYISSDLKLPNG
jgi:3-deoxy-D-manno-octulosonic-acid transferase